MELKLTKPLAFFDLETTGVNVGKDKIIEICIFRLTPDGITNKEDVLTMRINPGIPIPLQSTLIHGITDEDVKDMPLFKDVAGNIAAFLNNCDLAGYNSNKFDIPLLVEEFLRAGIDFDIKGRRLVDVQNIFHKMEPRTLFAAFKFYCNKTLKNAHSAEADTLATYHILKAQLDKYQNVPYEDRKGNESFPIINDIQALHNFSFVNNNVDLVGHIVFDEDNVEVFNFGKYKGKKVEDVFIKEPSYYDWMMKADFPLYTKKVITLIKLRGFNNSSVNIN